MQSTIITCLLFISFSCFGQFNMRMLMAGHDAVPEHFSHMGIIEVIQHEYTAAQNGDSVVKLNLRGTCMVLYNKDGYMFSKTEAYSANPRETYLKEFFRVTCTYDSMNTMLTREENGSYGGRCYTTYSYHRFDNGVLVQRKSTQVWGNITNQIIERYNDIGKLVSQEWLDSGKVVSRLVYVYDKAGDVKIDSEISNMGGPLVMAHKYDKHHNVIEDKQLSDDLGVPYIRYEYTYNEDDLWTKRIMYADGKPQYIDELEYIKDSK